MNCRQIKSEQLPLQNMMLRYTAYITEEHQAKNTAPMTFDEFTVHCVQHPDQAMLYTQKQIYMCVNVGDDTLMFRIEQES